MNNAIKIKCARVACQNTFKKEDGGKHRDLEGLYCKQCARKINDAAGFELIIFKK